MRHPLRVIAFVFTLGVGIIAGNILGNDPPAPQAIPDVVYVPKIETKEVIVEKTVFPRDCRDLVAAAVSASEAVGSYEGQVGGLPQLIDETYRAILTQDVKKLNDLKKEQRDLEAESLQSLLDVRSAMERIDKLKKKCDEAVR